MKIAIGSDHAGFLLKEKIKKYLLQKGYSVEDFGSFSREPSDYPDVARNLALKVSKGDVNRGILICGTGIGMAITANKVPGVYAALCYDEYTARISREHNNSNVLTFGGRTMKEGQAKKIVDIWLSTEFKGGRYERRFRKIRFLEPKREIRVAVSFLSENEDDMKAENILPKLAVLEAAGVDTIQWDLMDGEYNSNNTLKFFNPVVMGEVMKNTSMDGEAHLMVVEPWNFVDKIKNFSTLIFHLEACKKREDVIKTIDKIKSLGKNVGIAIEPETPVEALKEYLTLVNLVLVMSVKTGYAGQQFIDVSEKIRKLAGLRDDLHYKIEVDGGINDKTVSIVRKAGCDVVVSANFILNDEINDYKQAVKTLKGKS